MRDSKVINRFVCDTVLNSTKSKIGYKYIESDLAHLLNLRFCKQNKTKLLVYFHVLLVVIVVLTFCCVTCCNPSHNKTSINQ